MTIKLQDSNYKVENGKLICQSVNGWHDLGSKCVRNVGQYKIFADHFECALPYTNYYVADTKTGKVMAYRDHPSYLGSAVKELAEQVAEYGFGEPTAKQADPDEFDIVWMPGDEEKQEISVTAEQVEKMLELHRDCERRFERALENKSSRTDEFRAECLGVEKVLDILGIEWW